MFVTFEGIDGAGKTTLIARLSEAVTRAGRETLVTREPGSGEVGAAIRSILLDGADVCPTAELFLFLADRAQHVQSVVRPALERGAVVLCDRHADSTLVYQGYGRGLDLDRLREWNTFATGGLTPQLTFLLELSLEESARRSQKGDRLDRESLEFRSRVAEGFRTEAALAPQRWRVLDATQPPDALLRDAWTHLRGFLLDLPDLSA